MTARVVSAGIDHLKRRLASDKDGEQLQREINSSLSVSELRRLLRVARNALRRRQRRDSARPRRIRNAPSVRIPASRDATQTRPESDKSTEIDTRQAAHAAQPRPRHDPVLPTTGHTESHTESHNPSDSGHTLSSDEVPEDSDSDDTLHHDQIEDDENLDDIHVVDADISSAHVTKSNVDASDPDDGDTGPEAGRFDHTRSDRVSPIGPSCDSITIYGTVVSPEGNNEELLDDALLDQEQASSQECHSLASISRESEMLAVSTSPDQQSTAASDEHDNAPILLAPELVDHFKAWQRDASNLFAMIEMQAPNDIASSYAFACHLESKTLITQLLWRFVCTTFADILRPPGSLGKVTLDSLDFMVRACGTAGNVTDATIRGKLRRWARQGCRFRIFIEAIGHGCLFLLPFEDEYKYKTAAATDMLAGMAQRFIDRGIKQAMARLGADNLADQVRSILMKPFENCQWVGKGQLTFFQSSKIHQESVVRASSPPATQNFGVDELHSSISTSIEQAQDRSPDRPDVVITPGSTLAATARDVLDCLSRNGYRNQTEEDTIVHPSIEEDLEEKYALVLMLLTAFHDSVPTELFERARIPQYRWHSDGSVQEIPALKSDMYPTLADVIDSLFDSTTTDHTLADTICAHHFDQRHGLLSVDLKISTILLPYLGEGFWENQAVAIHVHAFPRDEFWEANLPCLARSLGPSLWNLVKRLGPCGIREDLRTDVVDCLLVYARFKALQHRSDILELAESLLNLAAAELDLQSQISKARCVLARSQICRIKGEYELSDEMIASFPVPAQPTGGLLNSVLGLLNISQTENKIQQNNISDASSVLSLWKVPLKPSYAELRVMPLRLLADAKVARAERRYQQASEFLRQILSFPTINDSIREQALFLFVDTLCDQSEFQQALDHIRSLRTDGLVNLMNTKTRGRFLCSELDVNIGLGRFEQALATLRKCRSHFRRTSEDMGEQLLHVRMIMADARFAHAQANHAESLRRWVYALKCARRYRSLQPEGCTIGTILLSIALEYAYLGYKAEPRLLRVYAEGFLCDHGDIWIPVITGWKENVRQYLDFMAATDMIRHPVSRSPQSPQVHETPETFFRVIHTYFEVTCKNMVFGNDETLLAADGVARRNDLCVTFDSLCYKATMLYESGSFGDFGCALNDAFGLLETVLKEEHPRTLTCFFEVLLLFTRSGLPEVALKLGSQIEALTDHTIHRGRLWRQVCQLLGRLDPETMTSAVERGWSCITDTFSDVLGSTHRLAISVRLDYMKRIVVNSVQEECILRDLLAGFDGKSMPSTPRLMLNLAQNLLRQRRCSEAEDVTWKVMRMLQENEMYGGRDAERVESWKTLAHSYFGQKDVLRAETTLLEALKMIETQWGRDHAWWDEFTVVLQDWRQSWNR
ncbi:Hypothetical protein D9617_48g089500 [Elsinoe fawcettii]|nr:Hypothetical protein D9617_48g089500 [Elsinoe fawcettii]